jgi:heat shock protein HslJ
VYRSWFCGASLLGTIALLSACASPAISDKPAAFDLTGTTWQLRSIQSMDDTKPTITLEQPELYTLHFQNNNLVSLRLDCNRGSSSWQATPSSSGASGQLTFGPIAMTRMFCPPPSLDNRVARDLSFVRSYLLRDGNLHLSLMADGGIYEWQPTSHQP